MQSHGSAISQAFEVLNLHKCSHNAKLRTFLLRLKSDMSKKGPSLIKSGVYDGRSAHNTQE